MGKNDKSNAASKVDKKPKKVEKKEEVQEVDPKAVEVKSDVEDAVKKTTTVESESDHGATFDQQLEVIAQLKRNVDDAVRKLTQELKILKKQVGRDMKARSKGRNGRGNKQTKDGSPRQCSGFTAPTNLSEELCKFLGKPPGTMMARTEVTRELTAYIKSNNLNSGRDIMPNTPLAKLLRAKDTDNVTYFNLQKFMKPHFARKDGSFCVSD